MDSEEESSEESQNATSSSSPSSVDGNLSFVMLLGEILVLASLPFSYLVLLTGIGVMGGGYQSRFLLPILPITAILSAMSVQWIQQSSHRIDSSSSSLFQLLFLLAIAVSAALFLFYVSLFSIYYAEVESSLDQIFQTILESPYPFSPGGGGRETSITFKEIGQLLRHFGVKN